MQVTNWISAVLLAGGGGGAVALAVVRAFGNKWLDQRFGARLEALRHENAKETERLKLEIAQQLDRANRLTQREFDALPELWQATADAVSAAQSAYIRFSQHSDLSIMSDEEAEEYLTRTEVPPHHRKEILAVAPKDRNQMFYRAESLKFVSRAGEKVMEASEKLQRFSIVLSHELLTPFRELIVLTRRAAVDAQLRLDDQMRGVKFEDADRLRKEGDELLEELCIAVRERLRA